ncbi:membrane-spanning 4-domains subfamily A member 4A-like [Mixophyes fleayi]|uniref:membrane-spanning 4-domains subfamily A member 4A-like n=1 Tax=Mixophyes fleayi TaxID=3061075 RepID=UPI003F4E2E00
MSSFAGDNNPPVYYSDSTSQKSNSRPKFIHSSLFQATFLKGKPKILGIVLIVTAILQVALGIASWFATLSANFLSGLPFWGSVFYIAAGILTLRAHAKVDLFMVKLSVFLSISTVIFSFTGLIMVCVDLYVIANMTYYEDHINGTRAGGAFVLAMLLITNIVLCAVALTISVFGCWAVGYAPVPQMFLINDDADTKSQTHSYVFDGNVNSTKA